MRRRALIVGSGAGGLAAAIALAAAGYETSVLERAATCGGKMRQTDSDVGPVDAGPTVFTMRFVFEELFAQAGLSLADYVRLAPLPILARHTWRDGSQFDLFADIEQAADAIGRFAGAGAAAEYRRFITDSAATYDVLLAPFMTAQKPSMMELGRRVGLARLSDLLATRPFVSLWDALGGYFQDPRLRQLFGRYATYCGASPFSAPATLMLIAHVEQSGVWTVEGGMHALAQAMQKAGQALGVTYHFNLDIIDFIVERGRICGIIAADGATHLADVVVFNGDCAALQEGALGRRLGSTRRQAANSERRSLSALTWTGAAVTDGFDLSHHTVFFSDQYHDEFKRIFEQRALPRDPTIYVCAQDRRTALARAPATPERLLVLVNAPPFADVQPLGAEEISQCETMTFERLAQSGLKIEPTAPMTRTTPRDFARMFPATGGAIYGAASHGPFAAFQRPGARTRWPGLYLASGSIHPSAGVPMATLSGMLAAQAICEDRPSMPTFRRAAIAGGTSMP
jgi:1-hydroxycarotenoid 3,4-desaturase